MKRFAISLVVVLLSGVAFAQTKAELYDKYSNSVSERDTSAIASLISDWEKLYPGDAELYSLRVNYYMMNAINEIVVISEEEPTDGRRYLVFDDSLGVTRYMYSEFRFDSVNIGLAEGVLAEGIAKYPDRLDLRFAKVFLHQNLNQNTLVVQEIQSALERSITNQNKWVWIHDKPTETDGMSYLRDCIQECFERYFYTDDMESAKSVIDAAIRFYPNDAIFLADRAGIYYYSDDLENALKWYLSSRENAPDDMLVTSNIARIYEQLGDKKNAVKFLRIVADSNDPEFAESAKANLERLNAQE